MVWLYCSAGSTGGYYSGVSVSLIVVVDNMFHKILAVSVALFDKRCVLQSILMFSCWLKLCLYVLLLLLRLPHYSFYYSYTTLVIVQQTLPSLLLSLLLAQHTNNTHQLSLTGPSSSYSSGAYETHSQGSVVKSNRKYIYKHGINKLVKSTTICISI